MNNFLLIHIIVLISIFVSISIFIYGAWKIIKTPYGKYEERYLQSASGKLNMMFIFLPPEAILYLKFLAGIVFLIIFFFLFNGVKFPIVQYVIAFVGGVAGFFSPDLILKFLQQKRLEKFEQQLLEGLTNLSNSLKAGFSFQQALEQLVKDTEAPISQEFGLVLKENRLGVSLEQSLQNLTRRVESDDLELVVSSIVLTRELGGNLSVIFERLAYTIRERMKLRGKINALTSQGKMQGWVVGLMPVVLGILISFINPQMMNAFLNSLAGWILLGVIVVLEIVGALIIKKIVTIDI